MSIEDYIEWYILYIPKAVYGWGLGIFLVVMLLLMAWKGVGRGFRYATVVLLVEYLALLFYFAVLIRPVSEGRIDWRPLWSYKAIMDGCKVLIQEHVMNVAVFVPVGLMLGVILKQRAWWTALLIGIGVSVGVEVSQLMMNRGLCEVDDVIHNTLGCAIGYGLWSGMRNVKK